MRVHHVAFRTHDVPRLRAFYEGTLGLRAIKADERSVWLDLDGGILMLEKAEKAEPCNLHGSMELLALAIDLGSHDAWKEKLAGAGFAIEARTEHTLYVRDPDGRRVGLSSYSR